MEVFNDIYINCKFAALFNMLTYFDKNVHYLVANNFPKFDSEKDTIDHFYEYNNEKLLDMIGIQTTFLDRIEKVSSLKEHIKTNDFCAIIKGSISNKEDHLYKEEKENFLLIDFHDDYNVNGVWKENNHSTKYANYLKKTEQIQLLYEDYIKNYYCTGIDVEPTVWVCKNIYGKEIEVSPYFIAKTLFNNKKELIYKNIYELMEILNNKINCTNIAIVVANLRRVKRVEAYRNSNIIDIKECIAIIDKQITIIDKLEYYYYRKENEFKSLCDEFIELEKQYYNAIYYSINMSNCSR